MTAKHFSDQASLRQMNVGGTEISWAELEQAEFVHVYIPNGIDMELSVQAHDTHIYINLNRFKHTLSPDMLFG